MSGHDTAPPRWVMAWRPLGGSVADPLDWFGDVDTEERFYWESPGEARVLAACGTSEVVQASGAARFARSAEGCRALARRVRVSGSPPPGVAPVLLGGFAFAPAHRAERAWRGFPGARWILPRCWVVRHAGRTWIASVAPDPQRPGGTEPERSVRDVERSLDEIEDALARRRSRAERREPVRPADCTALPDLEFEEHVRSAVRAIQRGELEKVVVARALRTRVGEVDGTQALRALRARHDDCRIFALGTRERLFLGASPERLVRLEGGRIAVDALAGSAPRGSTPHEDARLARALLESKKEQEEHAIVVRALQAALVSRCRGLRAPEAPRVKPLRAIQHLHTPLDGELRDRSPFALFDLLPDLHPSPAVAGSPREAALAWLRRHERLERGWYAGLVGWLDASGEGELDVALRSALLQGSEATLFAGAGVMAESDPGAEALETRLKLRAAAEALGVDPR